MNKFAKPVIFCSKCLGFDACRWNGVTIPDSFVESLKKYIEFKTTCPEFEIGLGVPRKQIGIVKINNEYRLIQHETELDVTEKMISFTDKYLNTLRNIDGFIMKEGSPSCGIKDVKIYPKIGRVPASERGAGLFGKEVLNRFPNIAVVDEQRLSNFQIREHFLTRIFASAALRELENSNKLSALVKFHSSYKLLLLQYNQSIYRSLGKIVANHEKLKFEEIFSVYKDNFLNAFIKMPRKGSTINVLMHAFGYFSKKISKPERDLFFELLEKYRDNLICISSITSQLKMFIARFGEEYLAEQVFFNPFPEKLISLTDSGKGREVK